MFRSFYPSRMEESVYSIDFDELYSLGFRNIIFDIDNTLVCHGAPQNEKSLPFLKELMNKGFKILFLSNNKEPRVASFNEPLGATYIFKAGKPNPKNYLEGVNKLNGTVENTLFIGDQLFTDVWGANKAGITSILVKPIDKHEEIQIILKRRLEWIVLKAYKRSLKKKKSFGLIGNPVNHSKSPLIHHSFGELLGDKLEYKLYPLMEEEIEGFLKKAGRKGIKGINVTVPYKEKVIPYLCGVGEIAKKIGAVNTLKLTKKGYFGINTDVTGLLRTYKEENIEIRDKDTVILGSGGASKGVAASLFLAGARSITFINRTYEKARELAEVLNSSFETDVFKAVRLSDIETLPSNIYVFQSTSLGLKGEEALITEDSFYEKLSFAMEIVPMQSTDFLNRCEKANVKCLNGFYMLLNQAVDSYEFWQNKTIDKKTIETVKGKLLNE